MVKASWNTSYRLTLAHEGGFVDHPRDPGGATNKGVTQKVYNAYRSAKGLPMRSVRLIEDREVSEIYSEQYAAPVKFDLLPAGVDYAVYDFAVNSGVKRASQFVQRLAGVDDDGIIGFVTLSAIKRKVATNEEAFIKRYCEMRMSFLESLSHFDTFGRGWTRRVMGARLGFQDTDNGVIDYAVKLARADAEFVMPRAVGALTGEVAGKAY